MEQPLRLQGQYADAETGLYYNTASRTINRRSPRMVKRRNSRYKAFQWGAPRPRAHRKRPP